MNNRIRSFAPVCNLGLSLATLALILVGCASSAPKADIAANANPNDEVTKLRQDLSSGSASDFAVLDQKDFEESKDHLAKAEEKLKSNQNQAETLNEVRISRGFYNRAESVSTSRRGRVQTILDARSLAVSSGALQYPQSRNELMSVDKDARDLAEASDLPSSDKVAVLQKRYGEVQLNALVTQNLGSVKSTIDAAKNQDASSVAPKTLNQAQVDYTNAVNAISMNRANPALFTGPVKQAALSGDTLAKVMEMEKKNSKNFNEDEAVKIVQQDRRIHSLDNAVTSEQAQKNALQAEKDSQSKDLSAAKQKVAMQKALQSAQDQFTPEEAEVYQQDNKLLIRLKSIGFASGSAAIPANSDALLDKVQTIVESLKPESVVVQGHTDSIGGKEINEKLSAKRADEVATYFEKKGLDASRVKTEGYGDAKPLATNKTKEGRSENRRIDILVTPAEAL